MRMLLFTIRSVSRATCILNTQGVMFVMHLRARKMHLVTSTMSKEARQGFQVGVACVEGRGIRRIGVWLITRDIEEVLKSSISSPVSSPVKYPSMCYMFQFY